MTLVNHMSDQGREALTKEEGEVLRAYKDIAGFWTIGVGLTRGSGVIDPKPGDVITREESQRLLTLALARSYEPATARAMRTEQQPVFDGAGSFTWNLGAGAIATANWVKLWHAGKMAESMTSFLSWRKAGGRVIAALERRRRREWRIMTEGVYEYAGTPTQPSLSDPESYRTRLARLGYTHADVIVAVKRFQADHDLEVDGKVGPATRSTIKRLEDARATTNSTAGAGAGGAAGGGAVGTGGGQEIPPDITNWIVGGALVLALVVLALWLVWRFRGPLFQGLPESVKDRLQRAGVTVGRPVRPTA